MSEYRELQDVVMDASFPELDLALRRGRHVDREDFAWYTLLVEGQDHLETFYRRYGCELVHKTDGYFYLLPTGDKLSRRQLSAGDMLVGQALALLYLDPATIERGGRITHEEVIAQLVVVLGSDALIRAFNPKRRRVDERVAQKTARARVAEAIRHLSTLGFVDLLDDSQLRLRPSLLRFAEPVRGLSEPAEALAKLVATGEVGLVTEGDDEADDADPDADLDLDADAESADDREALADAASTRSSRTDTAAARSDGADDDLDRSAGHDDGSLRAARADAARTAEDDDAGDAARADADDDDAAHDARAGSADDHAAARAAGAADDDDDDAARPADHARAAGAADHPRAAGVDDARASGALDDARAAAAREAATDARIDVTRGDVASHRTAPDAHTEASTQEPRAVVAQQLLETQRSLFDGGTMPTTAPTTASRGETSTQGSLFVRRADDGDDEDEDEDLVP
jgi:chromosome partition protein MukE